MTKHEKPSKRCLAARRYRARLKERWTAPKLSPTEIDAYLDTFQPTS